MIQEEYKNEENKNVEVKNEENKNEEHKNNDSKKEKKNEWKSVLREIIITIVVVMFVITFVAQPTTVDGQSMNPTLHDNDQLIIEKVSKYFTGYNRYDIIVFPYQHEENKYYIKRIIGLAGETVYIKNGEVFIDDLKLIEPYVFELIEDYGTQEFPITIPEGYVFVLGDNRNHSSDSRYTDVGLIKKSDILGKGYIRLFPFSDFGLLD